MARLELIQQIKFALSRLGDGNAHHEFEKIALAFARQRISANFLPATGPVSGRGDQGRDGETFWSNLANESEGETSAGRARIGGETVVLACTLQASRLSNKLNSDLSAIMGSGTKVDRVSYFVNSPVAVGDRHNWIAAADANFHIALEVFDLEALSINLADPDLFWIASEYLRIPSSAAPAVAPQGTLPEWYVEIRERWRQAGHPPSTFGDLAEARVLARAATKNDDARPDLDFALELLDQLAGSESPEIRWKAAYEICVATYRGTDDFRAIEARLLQLIETAIVEQLDPVYLQDATVLLSYGMGAAIRGRSDTCMADWRRLLDRLSDHVSSELEQQSTANYTASLLSVDVYLAFTLDFPVDARGALAAVGPESVAHGEEMLEGGVVPEALPLVSLERGMNSLQTLLELLPKAPMFPIGRIAEMFDLLTLSLVDHPHYGAIRAGIDASVAKTTGSAEAADRALSRALVLANSGKFQLALADTKTATVAYWDAHDVGGGAQSMIVEGDLLRVMGFHVAAKARYLAAAWAAGSHIGDGVTAIAAEALLGAAMQDYYLGRWMTALPELLLGFEHQARYLHNSADIETHEYLVSANQALVNILSVARFDLPLYQWIFEQVDDPGESQIWEAIPAVSAEMLQRVASEIAAAQLPAPFSDLDDSYSARWAAFGTLWSVSCENDPPLIRAAERLISTIQLMIVSLADSSVEWLPTTVEISVIAISGTDSDTIEEQLLAGGGTAITVALETDEEFIEMEPAGRLEILGKTAWVAAWDILAVAFVGDEESPKALAEALLGPGGAFSSPTVRLYDDTARVIEPRWDTPPPASLREGLPIEAGIPFVQTSLGRREGWSVLFDEEATQQRIRDRYDAAIPNLWRTLPRLVGDPNCMSLISALRSEGALDWQLLSAINNLVGTERVANAGFDLEDQEKWGDMEALMRSPETVDEADFRLETLTSEALEASLRMVTHSVLPSYGLHSYCTNPDLAAIEKLLTDRFGYMSVDVPHENVFGWPMGE